MLLRQVDDPILEVFAKSVLIHIILLCLVGWCFLHKRYYTLGLTVSQPQRQPPFHR